MKTVELPELESIRTTIDTATTEQHLDQLSAALVAAGPVPESGWRAAWRRWLAALVIASGIVVPAAAVAADGSLPGDALRGVRRTVEPMVGFVGDDTLVIESLADRVGNAMAEREEAESTDADGSAPLEPDGGPGRTVPAPAPIDRPAADPTETESLDRRGREDDGAPEPLDRPEPLPTRQPDTDRRPTEPSPEPTVVDAEPPAPGQVDGIDDRRSPLPDPSPTEPPDAGRDGEATPTPADADGGDRPPRD